MKNFSNQIPLVLAISFLGILTWAGWLKISQWSGTMQHAAIFFVCAYFLWIILELKISAGERTKARSDDDKYTCETYAFARGITVVSALILPTKWQEPGLWIYLAGAAFLFGVLFRFSAIYTLGKYYSHRVRLSDDHQIITEGPYRWLRHPAYTGMFFANLGFVLFFFNWIAAGAIFLILLPMLIRRIKLEEKVLFTLPGYQKFALERARLIPLIW